MESEMNSESNSGNGGERESEVVKESVWKFEMTKHFPLGTTSDAVRNKYRQLDYSIEDFYEHFPCFISSNVLGKYISLYECYKKTLGLAGHIAEMGVFRGASSLFFAKMSILHEPQTITQVHAFDWWKEPAEGDSLAWTYYEPFERIHDLVHVQGLQRFVLLHRLNILTELTDFFRKNQHLQFKLVYLDAGDYDLTDKGITEFWPRIVTGGILILDQFNMEVAPGETQAVKELLPEGAVIRTFPNGWMPTAYVVKGEKLGH